MSSQEYYSPRASFVMGVKTGAPLIFSAVFFGLIFGFTGASGNLRLFFVSAMSYIIFAGSAQFITLILIIKDQPVLAIVFTAIIINLRHLLYGLVLNPYLKFKGLKRALVAYLITDESFLVTTIVEKQDQSQSTKFQLDYVLLGSGIFLWSFWNLATIAGYFMYQYTSEFISFPDNFVISASFIGFLVDQFVNYKNDRGVILFSSAIAILGGFCLETSSLLVIIMVLGAIYSMISTYFTSKEGLHEL